MTTYLELQLQASGFCFVIWVQGAEVFHVVRQAVQGDLRVATQQGLSHRLMDKEVLVLCVYVCMCVCVYVCVWCVCVCGGGGV